MHLFPASLERQQIRTDLQKIYLQEAERAWVEVEYYQKKRNPRAVAVACIQLISEYPDTPYAKDARTILRSVDRRELKKLPQEVTDFVNAMPAEAAPKPSVADRPEPVKSVSDSADEESRGGRFRLP